MSTYRPKPQDYARPISPYRCSACNRSQGYVYVRERNSMAVCTHPAQPEQTVETMSNEDIASLLKSGM